MWKRILIASILAFAVSDTALAESCGDDLAVWATPERKYEGEIESWTITFPDGLGGTGKRPVLFEMWLNRKKAGSLPGEYECTNEAATICFVSVEMNLDSQSFASGLMERVDENQDGTSEWLVLAGFAQAGYNKNGAKIRWEPGFEIEEHSEVPFNIYKFERCRQP